MKKICIFYLVVFLSLSGNGQKTVDSAQPSTYLFDSFIDGAVQLKSGHIEPSMLNYDASNQNILFKQNGQNMILTGLENIDTVYMGDKKFIPAEDKFYQVATFTPIALLISYTYKEHPQTVTTDHNGTSRQNNNMTNNNISETYLLRRFEGQYAVEFIKRYWLRRGHSLYKANTEKEIVKVFPRKADAIKEFIESNKIDFNNQEDAVKLIKFCNDLP